MSNAVTQEKRSSPLTDRALLVGEEDAAVVAVCVGHADVVPICPVEFPEGGRHRESAKITVDMREREIETERERDTERKSERDRELLIYFQNFTVCLSDKAQSTWPPNNNHKPLQHKTHFSEFGKIDVSFFN